MVLWVGAQDQVKLAKKAKTCPHDVTHRKPQTQNEKTIFSIKTRWLPEYVKGLNSSLAQSAGELWYCKAHQKCGLKKQYGTESVNCKQRVMMRKKYMPQLILN